MRCPEGYLTDRPSIAGIQANLKTAFLGRTVLYAASTGSTNEDAKAAGLDLPNGTVFIAEVQTGGKGRIGRRWSSPPGGLFMSVSLRPEIAPSEIPALSIVTGYCVVAAIRDAVHLDARLKWPNDVLVDGRKVCGILCEMVLEPERAPLVIVGIGVNVNTDARDLPAEVKDTASSLSSLSGRAVEKDMLTAAILNCLEPAYLDFQKNGLTGLLPELQKVVAFAGEPVVVRNLTAADGASTQGVFRGIDGLGRAMVEIPGGEVLTFSAGDLSLRHA